MGHRAVHSNPFNTNGTSTVKTLFSAIFWCRLPNFLRESGGSSNFSGPKAPKSVVPRAEGARFTKIFENLKIFEKFLLKNDTRDISKGYS